jgi:hypothetical protein
VKLSAYAGLGMSPDDIAARYRGYAADCIKVAARLTETASTLRPITMSTSMAADGDRAHVRRRHANCAVAGAAFAETNRRLPQNPL